MGCGPLSPKIDALHEAPQETSIVAVLPSTQRGFNWELGKP
jgi:hypothetical protein